MNFVLVKNMKCASTALGNFLERNGTVCNTTGMIRNFTGLHSTFEDLQKWLHLSYSEEEIENMNWVSSVREPISRAESAYAHIADKKTFPDPDEWIRDRWIKIPSDEEMLSGPDARVKIFKVESINHDVKEWARSLNLPKITMLHSNTRKSRERGGRGVDVKFSSETKSMIRKKWEWTIKNFYP